MDNQNPDQIDHAISDATRRTVLETAVVVDEPLLERRAPFVGQLGTLAARGRRLRREDAVQNKEFPDNSILFIDSIHAAQPEVISVLDYAKGFGHTDLVTC